MSIYTVVCLYSGPICGIVLSPSVKCSYVFLGDLFECI